MSKILRAILYVLGGGLVALGTVSMLVNLILGGVVVLLGVKIILMAKRAPDRLSVVSDFEQLSELPQNYIVLDLETTGLDPACCEIIEVAAVRFIGGEESERFHSYVKPRGKISRQITALTGISNADVKDAPLPGAVAEGLSQFITGYTIVGYNVRFDISFIQTRLGIMCDSGAFDVLRMAKRYIHGVPNYKLQTLKEYLGLNLASHNAEADCETTQAVLLHCQRKWTEELERKMAEDDIKSKILAAVKAAPGIRKTELEAQIGNEDLQLFNRALSALINAEDILKGKDGSRIVLYPAQKK